MHRRLLTLFIASAFLGILSGCSDKVSSPEPDVQGDELGLSLPNTYDGMKIFEDAVVTGVEVVVSEKDATLGIEHTDCLRTIDCDTGLESYDFYRDENDDVCIGYEWTLCDWEGGDLSQAIALYLPGTTHIPDYLWLTSNIPHGYVGPNPGGCYIMQTFITYSIPGWIHGDFTIEWVQAVNYGPNCPPLVAFCGWPLDGDEWADPFTVHL
ncbi:MAG: hypothetical protein ACE5OP_13335 [Candidatus Glassbacteria bacterium]